MTGRLVRKQRTAKGFHRKYTREDSLLLAALDERHNTLSGPATKSSVNALITFSVKPTINA
jgi:hypothetical protein